MAFPFDSLLGVHYYEEELSSLVELGKEFLLEEAGSRFKARDYHIVQQSDALLLRFQEICAQNLELWLTKCGSRIFHNFFFLILPFKAEQTNFLYFRDKFSYLTMETYISEAMKIGVLSFRYGLIRIHCLGYSY